MTIRDASSALRNNHMLYTTIYRATNSFLINDLFHFCKVAFFQDEVKLPAIRPYTDFKSRSYIMTC